MNPKVEAMRRVLAEAECIADSAEVQRAIDRVAAEITEALAERDPLVYVVMKGAVVFAGQILPRLRFPLEVAYLHATRYHDTTAARAARRPDSRTKKRKTHQLARGASAPRQCSGGEPPVG